MTYIDGFVLPVKNKRINEYIKMAKIGAKIWKKHGALDYKECVGEDLHPKGMEGMSVYTFPEMVKPRPDETIVFSFITYKSRAHRDLVNKKVMKDMEKFGEKFKEMPFDMKRMAYGGFRTIVDTKNK